MGEGGEKKGEGDASPKPRIKDIRCYYCEFCGICSSKKSLIAAHLLSHHKDEIEDNENNGNDSQASPSRCDQYGASFRRPAYLRQYMQSHCSERPFTCPVDNCCSSYRRKDHLTCHLLQHKGKLFTCPIENCNHRFAFWGNMTQHVKELHDNNSPDSEGQNLHVCKGVGCGRAFKFASKLGKLEDKYVKSGRDSQSLKLDSVEAVGCEPGCMKTFSNAKCLKAHLLNFHQYIPCQVCGVQQLKKNIKWHLRTHEDQCASEKIKCSLQGCLHIFFTGDFMESDEQFRSRPRCGQKCKAVTVETMLRKRVVSPGKDSVLDNGSEYLSWLLSDDLWRAAGEIASQLHIVE